MQKVGNTTDTADANGEWTNGNVAQGVPPTIINATILNTWQRELIGVVESAGISLDPTDDNQVFKSINELFGKNISIERTTSSVCLKLSGGVNGFSVLLQAGRGVFNSTSGHVIFPKPFPNSVISVIPSKVSDNNRYVTASNYDNTGFDIFGWVAEGAGNVDNFSYIAVGW